MPNGQTVRLKPGNERIPEVVVREIATIKLEMHDWEYDYWLSEQDRASFATFKIPTIDEDALKLSALKTPERMADAMRMQVPPITGEGGSA